MGKQADINDTQVRATVRIDDGRDWTKWLNWKMREKYRIRNGVNEAPPARPQVAPVSFKSINQPRKKGYRVVQKAIGAV